MSGAQPSAWNVHSIRSVRLFVILVSIIHNFTHPCVGVETRHEYIFYWLEPQSKFIVGGECVALSGIKKTPTKATVKCKLDLYN